MYPVYDLKHSASEKVKAFNYELCSEPGIQNLCAWTKTERISFNLAFQDTPYHMLANYNEVGTYYSDVF